MLYEVITETFHSTGKDAARIAQKAEAGKLLIGHFSSRYKSPDHILEEAKAIFPNTEIGFDNSSFEL